ncbi:MAG: nicotinate-nucleotide adenylyltransferase [Hyphomonas sp.]|uniref:nicotinate-nucleotide adenylyltransferase n=1 Tax=Hyphomonas sp. TaxID=87 RepID=UPI003528EEA7
MKLPGPTAGLRIGLFGGSFNPAHSGHLHVAQTAMKRLNLDWVWWIVARGNPLKSQHGDFAQRFASARKIAHDPRMIVTDLEAQLGFTYSWQTLSAIAQRAPGADFVWIMGADNMVGFHYWQRWQDIARLMPIAIVARPGVGPGARNAPFARMFELQRLPEVMAPLLPGMAPPAWVYLKGPLDPSSSTAIREGRV